MLYFYREKCMKADLMKKSHENSCILRIHLGRTFQSFVSMNQRRPQLLDAFYFRARFGTYYFTLFDKSTKITGYQKEIIVRHEIKPIEFQINSVFNSVAAKQANPIHSFSEFRKRIQLLVERGKYRKTEGLQFKTSGWLRRYASPLSSLPYGFLHFGERERERERRRGSCHLRSRERIKKQREWLGNAIEAYLGFSPPHFHAAAAAAADRHDRRHRRARAGGPTSRSQN
jgi:hypothetical protein